MAAADSIFGRFKDRTKLQPSVAAALTKEQSKSIGLSRQKARYIADLAGHFVKYPAVYNHLEDQTDEQAILELTEIRWNGVWTAQMFLIFTLARPDVLAPDDVGLQNAMKQPYN